jgi:hypothetical protein
MRRLVLLLGLALAACASEPEPAADAPPAPAPAPPADSGLAGDTAAASDAPLAGDSILVGDPPTWVPGPLHAPPSDWTVGIVDVQREAHTALLRAVREGTHEGFVRVVFEFDARVPGYHVEYVDRPVRQCGSGEPVPIEGDAWLAVRLRPAAAHTEAGAPTVTERDRRPGDDLLRQLTLTCDFEADVTWVLGLAAPNGYRMAELRGPPRLVLDVQR